MKAIVIGSSTGGPEALNSILTELPKDLDATVIVAQHLPASFADGFVARLNKISSMPTTKVTDKEILERGHIYIIPGDKNFIVVSEDDERKVYTLVATQKPQPSIDIAFTSVAEHFGKETIGVVLTGMGDDGLKGSRAIKQFGGTVIAQDQGTSVVYGMPKEVDESGFADYVLPIDRIARRLIALVNEEHGGKE